MRPRPPRPSLVRPPRPCPPRPPLLTRSAAAPYAPLACASHTSSPRLAPLRDIDIDDDDDIDDDALHTPTPGPPPTHHRRPRNTHAIAIAIDDDDDDDDRDDVPRAAAAAPFVAIARTVARRPRARTHRATTAVHRDDDDAIVARAALALDGDGPFRGRSRDAYTERYKPKEGVTATTSPLETV